MQRLRGKVALVTGAARGLGLAIAQRFHDEGANVIVNDLDAKAAENAAAAIGGVGLGADVSDSAAVNRMFDGVATQFGRLDVLVNNAGINGLDNRPQRAAESRRVLLAQAAELMAGGPVRTHLDFTVTETDDDWRRMLAVHLDGTFFCTRAALRIMNPQLAGSIINMASIVGTAGVAGAARTQPQRAAFSASLARWRARLSHAEFASTRSRRAGLRPT